MGFIQGLLAPLRGLRTLIGHPRLWPLALGPAVVAALALGVAGLGALGLAVPAARWLLPGLEGHPLFGLGVGATFVLLLIGLGAAAWGLVLLAAIPLHDRLSERVEALHRTLPPPLSWRQALPRSVAHSLAGLALWGAAQVALLGLNLLPGLGAVLYTIGGTLVTAAFLGHQFMDGALSRQGMSWRAKLRWLGARPGPVLGLGLAGVALLAVPGLNLLALPVAIAGGTVLFTELMAETGR